MRLIVCLVASLALHALFFRFSAARFVIPTLAISLEPRSVDLQIRTRPKRTTVAPLPPKEEPKPTPLPKQQPVRKAPPPAPKTHPTPKRAKPLETVEQPLPKNPPSEYMSDSQRKPRLIERAEYLSNPPPEYPEQARRRKQEGTVTLLVDLDSRGGVKGLQVKKSSGFLSLDRAAEKAVAKWRFTPATIGKRGVPSQVIVPVSFKLNR